MHHKNGIKDDNRIENLELLPAAKYHIVDTGTKRVIKQLQGCIMKLELENKLLKQQLDS